MSSAALMGWTPDRCSCSQQANTRNLGESPNSLVVFHPSTQPSLYFRKLLILLFHC